MTTRGIVAVVGLVATLLGACARGTDAPVPAPSGQGPLLARVHTAGRVVDGGDVLRYSWPGTAFEGRFRGPGVGVVLHDPGNDYDVQIDGRTAATLVTPGAGIHWVRDLPDAEHLVRLVKRTESPTVTSTFGGFVAERGGELLPAPGPRARQIEFIGDSNTAGYGDLSSGHDCGDRLPRLSNADAGFAALAAARLNADRQLNAISGRGLVRNYDGRDPGVDFRTAYPRALLAEPGDTWTAPGGWHPQLVVIVLGANDFSTPLHPGERWATAGALVADFEAAYHRFLDGLRSRYGPGPVIVVGASAMATGTLADSARRIVRERNGRGDQRIAFWSWSGAGLDYSGCDGHPSRHDHEVIAERLVDRLGTLPISW